MTLRQLEAFKKLSENLNFTKTAEEMGIAQSAVTNQIKTLENELGVKLFERIGKSVKLSRQGEVLLPYANKMLALKSDISSLFDKESKKTGPRITVGVSEMLSHMVLPDIIREFNRQYPAARLKILLTSDIACSDEDPIDLLIADKIDIALAMTATENIPGPVKVHKKNRQNACLLSAFTHDLAGIHNVTAQDLSVTQFLLPEKTSCLRELFSRQLVEKGVTINIALESNSIEILKENATSGIGLCLLPEQSVRKELMNHTFERVSVDLDLFTSSVLLTHKDKWLSPELTAFLEIAKSKLN